MYRKTLIKTNILLCVVIALGFVVSSVFSYHNNMGIYKSDIEHVSRLTSDGIQQRINTVFSQPINVSLTMANDSLLKDFLMNEPDHLDDHDFLQKMGTYLYSYRYKYDFDSVFLVSTNTNRYYHFNGLDRILSRENEEDVWYYDFLDSGKEYLLNIDNDQAATDEITIFINCRITDKNGETMGIVGVGIKAESFQQLLREYQDNFNLTATLVDSNGVIEISVSETAYENVNFFDIRDFSREKDQILRHTFEENSFWYKNGLYSRYIVSTYIPEIDWFLIVENDTSCIFHSLACQFFVQLIVIVVVIGFTELVISYIIKNYKKRIVELVKSCELEHQQVFRQATEQLYENIYESDVTHNCAASESTAEYFKSVGVSGDAPLNEAIRAIANRQIKPEFRQGYIEMFEPKSILEKFNKGIDTLTYDFQISTDGQNYHWIRLTAHIFLWKEDNSVRMFTYRQNIDDIHNIEEKAERDPMTNMLNKQATQKRVTEAMKRTSEQNFAFFMLDIDRFKAVNDVYGHIAGDAAIIAIANAIRKNFHSDDIVGRVGGDEFVVFVSVKNEEWVRQKAADIIQSVSEIELPEIDGHKLTTSIGIAMFQPGDDFFTTYKKADSMLYEAKNRGKNQFAIDP